MEPESQSRTQQETFDKVLKELRNQKVQSAYKEGLVHLCLYRGPNETKCAIGHLIDDDSFMIEADSNKYGISEIQNQGHLQNVDKELLLSLQEAHDFWLKEGLNVWEEEMHKIAVIFGLTYNPP